LDYTAIAISWTGVTLDEQIGDSKASHGLILLQGCTITDMDYPVTQFWDYRLLFIYALCGGFVKAGKNEISDTICDLINANENFVYCMSLLAVLEKKELISATDLHAAKVIRPQPKKDSAELQVSEEPQKQLLGTIRIIEQHWFERVVKEYLTIFKQGLIFHPEIYDTVSYKAQKLEILSQLKDADEMQEITASQNPQGAEPFKFLETIFSMVDEGIVEIQSIKPILFNLPKSFKKSTRDSLTMFEAMIKPLIRIDVIQQENGSPKESVPTFAEAKIDGTQIYIGIKGEALVPLWRVRPDSGLYYFMHYLQSHTNQNIGIGDIQLLDGCKSYQDMTELVRNCRFNKQLKKLFFDGTSKKVVRFTPTKELSHEQLIAYNELLENIRN
jgi:hypothetical protein